MNWRFMGIAGIAALALVMVLVVAGCAIRRRENDPDGKDRPTGSVTPGSANFEDPGTLTSVRYEASGGSMNIHTEFEIEVNKDKIVRTFYYDDYYYDDEEENYGEEKLQKLDSLGLVGEAPTWDRGRVERKDVPTDEKLWNALVKEIEYLKPRLEECPETTKEDIHKHESESQMLDGGDYSLLHLTWEKDGVTVTKQYYTPQGKRWSSCLKILREMVRPVGRDLKLIGETDMVNMYLKTSDYSYQISPIDEKVYNFFVHGDSSSKKTLKASEWKTVKEFLFSLDLASFEETNSNDSRYLKIEYNDGIYTYYKIDKKTAESIREYLKNLK